MWGLNELILVCEIIVFMNLILIFASFGGTFFAHVFRVFLVTIYYF